MANPMMTSLVRRWTIGRVATDLAIVMVIVPFGLNGLAPSWPRGGCAMTTDFHFTSLGIAILGIRASWLTLKALNDAVERWLDDRANSRSRPKHKPLDDL